LRDLSIESTIACRFSIRQRKYPSQKIAEIEPALIQRLPKHALWREPQENLLVYRAQQYHSNEIQALGYNHGIRAPEGLRYKTL
jgi:hypothetical protein